MERWCGDNPVLTDSYGRVIDYLRLSVTDRCNLRCRYCIGEKSPAFLPPEALLTDEELLTLCGALARRGIRKIKLTGGEPLLRPGLSRLAEGLYQLPGIQQVTLTTNGVLLSRQLSSLVQSGIRSINISLDTLNPQRYAQITGGGDLTPVLEGVEAALELGCAVKLNCIPMAMNLEDIVPMAALAMERELLVCFIEMMPIGQGSRFQPVSAREVRTLLENHFGPLSPAPEIHRNGPASYWRSPGMRGAIGWIGAISHRFCESCNRIRLTCDGYLKLCLCYSDGVSLTKALRRSPEALEEAITRAVAAKPIGHNFQESAAPREPWEMWRIGG